MVRVFNHRPKAEVVRKALEEAREALANGALPSRVLPTPGPEYQAWGPGEVRTAALLSAKLWEVLDLSLETAADLSIHQRLLEVADELNLGYWVRELPRVQTLVRPGDKRVPAKEAGKQVARGIPVQCQQAREEAYLLQVAYWSHRFAQEVALRERVEKLITIRPGAFARISLTLASVGTRPTMRMSEDRDRRSQTVLSLAGTTMLGGRGALPASWPRSG